MHNNIVLSPISLHELEVLFRKNLQIALNEWAAFTPPSNEENQPLQNETPVTPKKLAGTLSVSLVTLNTWEKKGLIKGYSIGGRKYFYLSEINESLKGKSQNKRRAN